MTGRVTREVTAADTAAAMRSGDVDVLSTPRLLGLCEEASMAAIGSSLPAELSSVAVRVQVNHLAPVGVGGIVVADAVLERIEGRRLTFTIAAHADDLDGTLIGAGRLVRVIVDRAAFMAKTAAEG
jgi:predicted thioesterase